MPLRPSFTVGLAVPMPTLSDESVRTTAAPVSVHPEEPPPPAGLLTATMIAGAEVVVAPALSVAFAVSA